MLLYMLKMLLFGIKDLLYLGDSQSTDLKVQSLLCLLQSQTYSDSIERYLAHRRTRGVRKSVLRTGNARSVTQGARISRDLEVEARNGAYGEGYLDQNLDRNDRGGSHAPRVGKESQPGRRWKYTKCWIAREKNGTEAARRGEARRGEGARRESAWSRVSERARPTPSCSCLPPTACNFLAKALMRGLARDGRSPDGRSRRG